MFGCSDCRVPGNHDYWVLGGPGVHYPSQVPEAWVYDQFGWGFAQFYAQDTALDPTHGQGGGARAGGERGSGASAL